MKKYVTDEIGDSYKEWERGKNYFIKAGTGRGKSYFVKTELKDYCKENGLKILMLSNRDNLKEQLKNDIGEDDTITILNYQKIESDYINNIKIDQFDYIVCDEAHYFFTDSTFNKKTDLSLAWILKQDAIKIFMSATHWLFKKYCKEENIDVSIVCKLKPDYSYIENVTMYVNDITIESIIESIPEGEQIIFFSRRIKEAHRIAEKYSGAFICSQHNKNYSEYIDKNERERILKESQFNSHLLCATTALDNGVNIKEFSNVKHVILDIFDRDTFLQCLGRKRIGEGEKINLYFRNYSNGIINGFRTKCINMLERPEYLIKYGVVKYIKHNFKQNIYTADAEKMIDEVVINNETGKYTKSVNKAMYCKYKMDLLICDRLLDKEYPEFTYKKIIANQLGISVKEIAEMETVERKLTLSEVCEENLYRWLTDEEKNEFIEIVDHRINGKRKRSLSSMNYALNDMKLPYIIEAKAFKYTGENGKQKSKTKWRIGKKVFDESGQKSA